MRGPLGFLEDPSHGGVRRLMFQRVHQLLEEPALIQEEGEIGGVPGDQVLLEIEEQQDDGKERGGATFDRRLGTML